MNQETYSVAKSLVIMSDNYYLARVEASNHVCCTKNPLLTAVTTPINNDLGEEYPNYGTARTAIVFSDNPMIQLVR
jgi:hypothetical protein